MSVLKGTRIFSPTLGWSSYLHGFFQCPMVTEYVGTDVIPDVCEKTKLLGNHYNKKCEIFCKPSENLLTNKRFLNKYREHFDLVFFSPPYYRLELYDSDNQSTHKYKSYESWLINYWEKNSEFMCNKSFKTMENVLYTFRIRFTQHTILHRSHYRYE